mmetsp:Transcript_25706/g.52403  ORF Transcript_25706/g.52403 Transcript_25706/m.52403 type:complete len:165 (+) Transcript_25706:41-535(+)
MSYITFALVLLCVLAMSLGESVWEDSETLSTMWSVISMRDTATLKTLLDADETNAFLRAADGRGPLFWAYEFGHVEGIQLLEAAGVDNSEEAADGKTPTLLGEENVEANVERTIALKEAHERQKLQQQQQQQQQAAFAEEDDFDDEDDEDDEDDDEEDGYEDEL